MAKSSGGTRNSKSSASGGGYNTHGIDFNSKGGGNFSVNEYLDGSTVTKALNEARDNFSEGFAEGIVNSLNQDAEQSPNFYKLEIQNLNKLIIDKETLKQVRQYLKEGVRFNI